MQEKPGEFAEARDAEHIRQDILERMGSCALRKFERFVEEMRRGDDDDSPPAIEHQPGPFDPDPDDDN
jgi:hypothetical protein